MYVLKTTVAKPIAPYSAWEYVDAGERTFADLALIYKEIYFVLENEFLPSDVCLDFDKIRADVTGRDITVNAWLDEQTGIALPTQYEIPRIRKHTVGYEDPRRAGYKIYLADGVSSIDDQSLEGKTDIKLIRPDTNYADWYKYCLASVNGYFHLTDYDINGGFILDCVKSLRHASLDLVGLYSFESVGALEYYPIKADMLYKRYPDVPYAERVDIKLPVDHTDKTVLLVVGGYLHLPNQNIVQRTGTNTLSVDFRAMNWTDRYFESRKYLDLSELEISKNQFAPDQVNLEELHSDAVIERLFLMSQTFVVLVDAKDVSVGREYISSNGKGLQSYDSGKPPGKPLIVGCGRVAEYWHRRESPGRWAISVVGNDAPSYLYRTADPRELVNIDSARTGAWPYEARAVSSAFFVDVSTTRIWD